MKKYEVISFFTDLQDNNHPYEVGDSFPRQGVEVSSERLEELSGSNNKQHRPLIQCVGEEPETVPAAPIPQADTEPDKEPDKKKYTEAELSEMKLPQIRELAKSLGFKCSSTSKEAIIAEFLQKQQ